MVIIDHLSVQVDDIDRLDRPADPLEEIRQGGGPSERDRRGVAVVFDHVLHLKLVKPLHAVGLVEGSQVVVENLTLMGGQIRFGVILKTPVRLQRAELLRHDPLQALECENVLLFRSKQLAEDLL